MQAGLTCGTDLKMFERGHPKLEFPTPFGHEAAGFVDATGDNVTLFSPGDRVMFPISAPCGTCPYCLLDRENLCDSLMKNKMWGTFSDYIIVPGHIVEWQTYVIPDQVPFREAALLDPFASVLFSWNQLTLYPGGGIVILGAGAIAYLHALVALDRGFRPVMVVGRRPGRLAVFSNLDVDVLIHDHRIREKILDRTGGLGAELVIETTGSPEIWETGLLLARGGGTVLAFAGCEEGSTACIDTTRLHYDQLTVLGSFHYDRRAVSETYSILAARQFDLSPLFSGTYPLEELPGVLDLLIRGEGMKYVLEPS